MPCVHEMKSELISRAQQKLLEFGLIEKDDVNGIVDKKMINALSIFQSENDLPIGNLNFETIDFMEINY